MLKKNETTYLPNLDGLRFVSAFFIILIHIEGLKLEQGKIVLRWATYFRPVGALDVTLFFVLSGFIITYLLLKEKEKTNTIQLKKFYVRRILRIWPLYFFIVFIGLFIFPHLDTYFYNDYSTCVGDYFLPNFISCLLFIPAFLHALPMTLGQIWSVRVEEFFYFFLPIVLKNKKNYMKIFLVVIFGTLLLRNAFALCIFMQNHYHIDFFKWRYFIITSYKLLNEYRVSTMAIGGIGAYMVVFDKQKILSFIYKKKIQYAVYAITFLFLIFKIKVPIIYWEFYSVLFAIIIVNLATNPLSVVKLDYTWMNYLGKISYGLYLYNPIMRVLCIEFVEHLFKATMLGWKMNLLYYILTITSTILVSMLSYHLMEKPFLNLKKRFAAVDKSSIHPA